MPKARVERAVTVDAPVDRVWRVLTEPANVAAWCAFGGAAIDPRPGGAPVFPWAEHGEHRGRVIASEPCRRCAFRNAMLAVGEEPSDGNATWVEFTLEPAGGATTLQLV